MTRLITLVVLLLFIGSAASAQEESVYIQVRFTFKQAGYEYHDALYFTEAEYKSLSKGDIDAMKQARFDAWLQVVQNPQSSTPPTLEELEAHKLELEKQLAEVITEIEKKK